MSKAALLLVSAVAFGFAPLASRLGFVGGSVAEVALGIVIACAASGRFTALAIAGGALGAFAGGLLYTTSPATAGAVLVVLAFAERTLRVRSPSARALHAGVAAVAGALAGSLATSFASASFAVRAVAAAVAAVLVALPLLVDADHPLSHELDAIASDVPPPVETALRESAELRRTADDALLDANARRDVTKAWAALQRLGEARARLERSGAAKPGARSRAVVARLDERITQHADALSRAYAVSGAADAAEVTLDDAALRRVETRLDSLEEVSETMASDV